MKLAFEIIKDELTDLYALAKKQSAAEAGVLYRNLYRALISLEDKCAYIQRDVELISEKYYKKGKEVSDLKKQIKKLNKSQQ